MLDWLWRYRARPTDEDAERVAELKKTYFGPLAQAAGTLGWLLEDYLKTRWFCLILSFDTLVLERDNLNRIADLAADDSFYYLCQFLHIGRGFQQEGGGLYLFGAQDKNEHIRRLHNAILAQLPQGDASDAIDVYGMLPDLKEFDVTAISFEDFRRKYGEELEEEKNEKSKLRKGFEAYRDWLREASPQVVKMAGASLEYGRVVSRELALPFVEDRVARSVRSSRSRSGDALISGWSKGLVAAGLDSADEESTLPRPLGRATGEPPEPHRQTQVPRSRADADEEGREVRRPSPQAPPPVPRGLAELLADAYKDLVASVSIAKSVGIAEGKIEKSQKAFVVWCSILEEARRIARLEDLLKEVLDDDDVTGFHDAVRDFLQRIRDRSN